MVAILILLVLAGAALYILNMLPIDNVIKQIAYVIIIVAVAIYAIRLLAPALPGLG